MSDEGFPLDTPPPPETSACIIATFGPNPAAWNLMAEAAMESAVLQSVPFDIIMRVHSLHGTLAQVRNGTAQICETDWLCFLDADDRLDLNYNAAMLAGEGDLRWPSVSMNDGFVHKLDDSNFEVANHVVIGAFVQRQEFLDLGGFAEMDSLEDWDLWKRIKANGATFGYVPGAIYRVTLRPGSRNVGNWGNP